MDSIRVSEAPDPGSIPGEATKQSFKKEFAKLQIQVPRLNIPFSTGRDSWRGQKKYLLLYSC